MRFSVIIPVYQAEKTIARCLDSLLTQRFPDAELLVVNDGSTDRSGEICREYAREHDCIRYFEKENGGVSSARNLGLDHAQGEYVLFVDSDDYVSDRYFRSIDGALNAGKPDLLLFGNCFASEPDRPLNCFDFRAENAESASEEIAKLLTGNRFNALWMKAFSGSIISAYRIRFDESIEIAEDLAFIFGFLMHSGSVKAIPEALYFVDTSNADSLSRKVRPDLGEQLMYACLSMQNMLERAEFPDAARKRYAEALSWLYYRSVYSAAKELAKTLETGENRRQALSEICAAYTGQGIPAPGWKNKLIALPVRMRMTRLIDRMARGR